MTTDDRALRRATRDLRARMGLSQTAFGRRIGRTLNTVLRYESQMAPRGEALIPYAILAIECQFDDLADLFRTALIADLGADIERVIGWKQQQTSGSISVPHEVRTLVDAFLTFMSAKDLQPAEELARNSLKQLLINEYSTASLLSRRNTG